MTRSNLTTAPRIVTTTLLVVMVVGCASLRRSRDEIIRVDAMRNPTEAARLTLVGIKALEHGEFDRAINRFVEAIAADDTYGPAHNNLGLLYYQQGNLYQAALAFEQAMELMPQDPTVCYNLGLTLESAGRTFEAMDLYWQAVEMDPVNPFFLGNLVRLRLRLGEEDETLIQQLQELIVIETRPDWRRWADQQLALNLNPSLDRGPAAPEFDTESDEDSREQEVRLQNNIIELSPTPESMSLPMNRPGGNETSPLTDTLPPPSTHSMPTDKREATIEPVPVPLVAPRTTGPRLIEDSGSVETLPPSIRENSKIETAPEIEFE